MKQVTNVEAKRIYVDKGYKGHNYENKLRVYTSGQRRGVHGQIKRELKRRSAIEPIIGHAKCSHKLDRHKLKGALGDKINDIFSAIGFNLRQILNFIKKFCHIYIFVPIMLIVLFQKNYLIINKAI